MKKSIFTFIVFICTILCTCSIANAHCDTTSTGQVSPAKEIEIKDIAGGGLLRSAPAPVVSAWLADGQIDLTFLQYLGTVTITVANAQETVYSATVTAEDGTQTTVSTAGWSPGSYTITITRSNGQTLTGDFEL